MVVQRDEKRDTASFGNLNLNVFTPWSVASHSLVYMMETFTVKPRDTSGAWQWHVRLIDP